MIIGGRITGRRAGITAVRQFRFLPDGTLQDGRVELRDLLDAVERRANP
jgi:hypothetical protein